MKTFPHIRTLSRWLRVAALVTMVALPVLVIWGILSGHARPDSLALAFPALPQATTFTAGKAVLTGAVGATMLLPALYALWQMQALFGRYLSGEVLSQACARHIRRIGLCFVALAVLGILIPTVQALILTADNPAGQRVLSVALSSDIMGFLLAGGLLTVIGWAMVDAAEVAEENAGFV